MRVAVDATAIPGRRLGAGVYVTELLRRVEAADVDLHVFVNARDSDELGAMLPHATLHAVRLPNRPARLVWSHWVLPRRLAGLAPDVFHGPHYTVPAKLPCPAVVTFHDPTFFTLPELHEPAKVAYFTRAARAGVQRAARVIAVSEYSRRGAIDQAGAEPDRVDVVPEGVDATRFTPGDGSTAPQRPYILFVGALEPRKDVPSLIAAYDELRSPHELVLTGPPAWGTRAVENAIAQAHKDSIRRTGYVTEDEKIDLYRHASVFVYPSIAEGVGLPVLEAMACGTPVVTTTGSAPEEVAGDAALLVPPRDVGALRDAIARVIDDAELAQTLRRRGTARAACYTWEAAATSTIEVWRAAAS